jgi:uncharacterized membrane protein YozB (DUF420 family)
MLSATDLPTLNALLNGTCALVLVTGYACIRRKKIAAHRACMVSACVLSGLFLVSYVTYHRLVGFTRFTGEGWIRAVYFSILIPHTLLAALALPPLVVVTLRRALKSSFDRHRRIARWTLPVWLYVSVTGVLVYWMLYHR